MIDIDAQCPHCGYVINVRVEMESEPIWKIIHCSETSRDLSTGELSERGCGNVYAVKIEWITQVNTFELEWKEW